MIEIYRDINDFPNYQISNLGKVRHFVKKQPRLILTKKISKQRKEKGLKKYIEVELRKEGKVYKRNVSRLLAETFIDNPENHKCLIFKDKNPYNIELKNLQWVSGFEFMVYSMGHPSRYITNLENGRKKKCQTIEKAIEQTENALRYSIKLLKYYKSGNNKYLTEIIEANKKAINSVLCRYFKRQLKEHFANVQLNFLDAVSRHIVIGQNLTSYLMVTAKNYCLTEKNKSKNTRGYMPYHNQLIED